jgi:ligand-binding sensor domain-containing protein
VKLAVRIFLVVNWVMSSLVVRAQSNTLPFGFEHIQEQQGLSHSVMSAILQDRDGFLWLGTFEGLNRFDGTHFTIFKSNPDNRRSLGNNRIHALCQDKTGRIWIGTHKGVNYFDPTNGQITRIDSVAGKPLGVCYNMLCDRVGNVWFTDNQLGLIRYQVQALKFDLYPIAPSEKRKLTGQIPRRSLLEELSGYQHGNILQPSV